MFPVIAPDAGASSSLEPRTPAPRAALTPSRPDKRTDTLKEPISASCPSAASQPHPLQSPRPPPSSRRNESREECAERGRGSCPLVDSPSLTLSAPSPSPFAVSRVSWSSPWLLHPNFPRPPPRASSGWRASLSSSPAAPSLSLLTSSPRRRLKVTAPPPPLPLEP